MRRFQSSTSRHHNNYNRSSTSNSSITSKSVVNHLILSQNDDNYNLIDDANAIDSILPSAATQMQNELILIELIDRLIQKYPKK